MKEENQENVAKVEAEAPRCTENTKPAKPAGMGPMAYCPCNNGQWGDWVDPHVA